MERENSPKPENEESRLEHLIKRKEQIENAYKFGTDEEYSEITHGRKKSDHDLIMEDLRKAIGEADRES